MSQPIEDVTTFDERTLSKVYQALADCEIVGRQAIDAVSQMQNRGLLFREPRAEFISEHLDGIDAVKVWLDREIAKLERATAILHEEARRGFAAPLTQTINRHYREAYQMLRKELEWIENDGLDTTPDDEKAGRL